MTEISRKEFLLKYGYSYIPRDMTPPLMAAGQVPFEAADTVVQINDDNTKINQYIATLFRGSFRVTGVEPQIVQAVTSLIVGLRNQGASSMKSLPKRYNFPGQNAQGDSRERSTADESSDVAPGYEIYYQLYNGRGRLSIALATGSSEAFVQICTREGHANNHFKQVKLDLADPSFQTDLCLMISSYSCSRLRVANASLPLLGTQAEFSFVPSKRSSNTFIAHSVSGQVRGLWGISPHSSLQDECLRLSALKYASENTIVRRRGGCIGAACGRQHRDTHKIEATAGAPRHQGQIEE
eukprot:IDg5940t1